MSRRNVRSSFPYFFTDKFFVIAIILRYLTDNFPSHQNDSTRFTFLINLQEQHYLTSTFLKATGVLFNLQLNVRWQHSRLHRMTRELECWQLDHESP